MQRYDDHGLAILVVAFNWDGKERKGKGKTGPWPLCRKRTSGRRQKDGIDGRPGECHHAIDPSIHPIPVCQARVHGLPRKQEKPLHARPERSPATKSTCSHPACALARSTKKQCHQVTVRSFLLL